MAKSKIIKDLARGEVGVETALKELKLLLLSFPNEKITNWVNKELAGYDSDDEVPSYRTKSASLKGSFFYYNTSISNAGIPIKAGHRVDESCEIGASADPVDLIGCVAFHVGRHVVQK